MVLGQRRGDGVGQASSCGESSAPRLERGGGDGLGWNPMKSDREFLLSKTQQNVSFPCGVALFP
jgi:hypothetical protein